MTRRCSHCSNNGHNSRTCPNRGVKLFGVRLTDGSSIRKSVSMGNLSHYSGSNLKNGLDSSGENLDHGGDGYASEDFVPGSSSSSRERKKGVPWTEEEHKMFLLGLQKLGKGDWRGIARNYVITRTPTQVASHAQKYFIRQCNMSRRKRRSSLFDMIADESAETPIVSHDFFSINPQEDETQIDPLPASAVEKECEPMESANSYDFEHAPLKPENSQYCYPVFYPASVSEKECEPVESANSYDFEHAPLKPENSQYCYPVFYPASVSPIVPSSYTYWSGCNAEPTKSESHVVLRPTAVHSKSPINVDELVGMSKLSLGASIGTDESSSLSIKLIEGSSRQSAFHANPAPGTSGMTTSGNSAIHAV